MKRMKTGFHAWGSRPTAQWSEAEQVPLGYRPLVVAAVIIGADSVVRPYEMIRSAVTLFVHIHGDIVGAVLLEFS